VVCTPSLHESGERREWDGGLPGEPAVLEFPDLWDAVQRLAEACRLKPDKEPDSPKAEKNDKAGYKFTWDQAAFNLDRARKYLAAMPEAIEKQNGSKGLYAAATPMVWGFELSEDVALRLLVDDYNPRCKPPWSDEELRHKVHDAATKPHDKPKGWLKNAPFPDDDTDQPPSESTQPEADKQPTDPPRYEFIPSVVFAVGDYRSEWAIRHAMVR
jgi:hypothetical protein